jgi:putative ABC transport system permease protein
VGTLLGLTAALLIGRLAFGSSSFGADTGAALLDLGLAAGAGLLIAGLAVVVPAWRDARRLSTVAAARRVRRLGGPSPLFLAGGLALLVVAGLVYLAAQRSGYELVLAPEGIPSVSVNYLALLGPASLWLGAALIVWWLSDALLAGGRRPLARRRGHSRLPFRSPSRVSSAGSTGCSPEASCWSRWRAPSPSRRPSSTRLTLSRPRSTPGSPTAATSP